MYEEQQKRTKLFSVITGLTSIKQQLQLLMPPKSGERTTDTNQKTQNPAFKQSVKAKLSPEKQEGVIFKSPEAASANKASSRSYQKGVLAFQAKSRPCRQSPLKIDKQMVKNQPKSSTSQKKTPLPFVKFDSGVRSSEKLKFLPKNQREKNNNVFVEIVNRAANEQQWMASNQKSFGHCRHSSQKELYVGRSFNGPLVHTLDIQKQFKRQLRSKNKPFFQFRSNAKQKTSTPGQEVKKLLRIKSDLVDHSEAFKYSIAENVELEGYSTSRQDLAERIKQLQQENYQKQGIIHILEAELAQIQATFTEMKHSIAKIFRIGGSSIPSLEQIDLNEELSELVKDLELQRDELKRISIDCELWKQKSVEQALQIKECEASLQKYAKIDLAFDQLRQENCKYKDQLVNIASKLEVSITENKIKDEFIVKFLMGRGTTAKQDDKIGQLMLTLEEYLKTFAYPCNRLLQKLNEEQEQIKKLRQMIEKA